MLTRSTLRHLGDALDDGEEDAAEVEVRRERLRELEDDLRVLLLLARARRSTPRRRSWPADARDELDRLEGLADEVVGARLEGARDLLVGVERGEDDDGQVARLRRARAGCAGSGSRPAAASRGRAGRAKGCTFSICSSASVPEPTATCGSSAFASAWIEDVPTDGVVVDDQDGPAGHVQKSTRPTKERRSKPAAAQSKGLALAARSNGSRPSAGAPPERAGLPRAS